MKKLLVYTVFTVFLFGCNINPNKEERIQKLETELKEASKKISELEKSIEQKETQQSTIKTNNMKLGAFSISLSVKDLGVSKTFYEHLGFKQLAGELSKNYLIMKNENSLIGLFQGMFEGNILTFNPGWDENGKETNSFIDIREIQKELKSKGIDIGTEINQETSGPASFITTDPDGNIILIDQHRS